MFLKSNLEKLVPSKSSKPRSTSWNVPFRSGMKRFVSVAPNVMNCALTPCRLVSVNFVTVSFPLDDWRLTPNCSWITCVCDVLVLTIEFKIITNWLYIVMRLMCLYQCQQTAICWQRKANLRPSRREMISWRWMFRYYWWIHVTYFSADGNWIQFVRLFCCGTHCEETIVRNTTNNEKNCWLC